MELTFTDEQEELRASIRRFLEEKSPETEVRRVMETAPGYDAAVWHQMAEQLGLQGLSVPEEYGGSGYGHKELAVVFEEMGRRLLCSPYFATVAMATPLLLASGDAEAMAKHLPGIASGSTVATVALAERSGRLDADGVETIARRDGEGWRITGEKYYVLDGCTASLVLVVARADAGISVFAVDADAPGLTATAMSTLDLTRKQAVLRFDEMPATLVGQAGAGWPSVSRMLDLAAVALAAEQVGGAQVALDQAVDYAKNRVQFGRTIGSFQSIKHKCSNMLLDVETAKACAYAAAESAANDDEDVPLIASMARAYCSDAFSYVAAESIQIHGGIGYTWEHPAHLYYRRARSTEALLGDPSYHRELLAQRMNVGEAP